MKIATFIYTDSKGKISKREVVITGMPSDKLSGIDISEMVTEDCNDFVAAYSDIQARYISDIENLKAEFDLKHNFRQFLEKNITEMEVENY